MLASADGYFYIYNIPELGGDCEMVKQHRVDPECSEVAAASGQPSLSPPDSPAVIPVTQVTLSYSRYRHLVIIIVIIRKNILRVKTILRLQQSRIQNDVNTATVNDSTTQE